MNRTSIGLGILLALSLGVNVALLGRRSPPPAAPPPASSARAAALPSTSDAPLQEERRKVELLETRVRELEAEKRILAESGPAPDRLALLRQKLRRAAKLFDGSDPHAWNDPANQMDYQDAALDVQRIALERLRDPKSYQDLLRLIYDMALESPPLPEAQRALVGKIFDELATAAAGLKADSAGERLVKELELESAALERLRQTLGPERAQKLQGSPLLNFAGGLNANAQWIQGKNADDQLLSGWAQIYGLDAAQKESARPLARRLVEELGRLSARDTGHAYLQGGSPESYAFRRDTLRAQLDVLRQLESGWSSEQRERFRTKVPRYFMVLPQAFQVQSPEEDENP